MKKYLMTGVAAVTMCAAFTSCSHDEISNYTKAEINQLQAQEKYDAAFINAFGKPASNQTWGFGSTNNARTRSMATPEVLDIEKPFDEAWVAEYLNTAKEPDANNIAHNNDNTTYERKADTYSEPYTTWYAEFEKDYPMANYGNDWNKTVAAAKAAGWEHFDDLFSLKADEDFVLNFKITSTYSGDINVAGTEGYTDGVANGNERTVVVTGTWNITADQKIGSLGKIIIANGGVVNVAEGKTLNMVNEARLVVLPGGKLTGAGKVEVNNGNAVGQENYNAGTIDVATFNNNFGKFYNYGSFLVKEYQGGAKESNFYNHSLAAIDHFGGSGSTANARIFNGCQFYVKNDARIRNYEGVGGSALIVGGQLLFSGSEDGTSTPTYVGLEAGALVQAGSLYNNGTSWTGPTEGGYAVLNIGKFDYMNWVQDHPDQGGYFANNIYLVADVLDNVPDGNGMQQKTDDGTENYTMSKADWKFKNVVANAVGNGNVTIAEKGDYEVIPADDDFKLGEAGCTPGFKIKEETPVTYQGRIFAEDLSAEEKGDFDFNDVVFDWRIDGNTEGYVATIQLLACGGTLELYVGGEPNSDATEIINGGVEVHNKFGVSTSTMVNTGLTKKNNPDAFTVAVASNDANDIKLWVKKNGTFAELKADRGKPACKINVPVGTKWVDEYENIADAYNWFTAYVGGADAQWNNVTNTKLVDLDLSNNK